MHDKTLKTITIIPNNNILDVPVYYNESYILFHHQLVSAFSLKYNLPYLGENSDEEISKEGHILIKTWFNSDMALCYINFPITKEQYRNLLILKPFLYQFSCFMARSDDDSLHIYSRKKNDKEVIDYFFEEVSKHIESRAR